MLKKVKKVVLSPSFYILLGGIMIGFALTSIFFHKTGSMRWIYESGRLVEWVAAIGTVASVIVTLVLAFQKYIRQNKKVVKVEIEVDHSSKEVIKTKAINRSEITLQLTFSYIKLEVLGVDYQYPIENKSKEIIISHGATEYVGISEDFLKEQIVTFKKLIPYQLKVKEKYEYVKNKSKVLSITTGYEDAEGDVYWSNSLYLDKDSFYYDPNFEKLLDFENQ